MADIDCAKGLVLGHLVSKDYCLPYKLTDDCQSGDIYLACNILDGHNVAVKLESASNQHQTL